jgi:hypothetical protein
MPSRALGAFLALVAAAAFVVSIATSSWWVGHPVVDGKSITAKDVHAGPLGITGCNVGGDGSCEPVAIESKVQVVGYAALATCALATLLLFVLASAAWRISDHRKGIATTSLLATLLAAATGSALLALGPGIQATQHVAVPIGWGAFVFGGGVLASLLASVITRKLEPEPLRLKTSFTPAPARDVREVLREQHDGLRPAALGPEPKLGAPAAMMQPAARGNHPLIEGAPQLRPLYELPGNGAVAPAPLPPAQIAPVAPMAPLRAKPPSAPPAPSAPPPPRPRPLSAPPPVESARIQPAFAPAARPKPPSLPGLPRPKPASEAPRPATLAHAVPPPPPTPTEAQGRRAETDTEEIDAAAPAARAKNGAKRADTDLRTGKNRIVDATDVAVAPAPEPPASDPVSAPEPTAQTLMAPEPKPPRDPDDLLKTFEQNPKTPIPTIARAPATPIPSLDVERVVHVPLSTAPASLPPPKQLDPVPSGPSPACPQCESPMAWVEEHLRFYCKSCRMYF